MNKAISVVTAVSRVVGVIAATMIVVAVAITCQMIFLRYFLNASTVWQTEIVIYLMIGATLIGLPYVQTLKGHVSVDLLPIMLPPKARKAVLVGALALGVVVFAIMTYFGWDITQFAYARNWTSETVNAIPLWIPYSAMPLGFGLFTLQLLADMLELISTPADEITVEVGGH